jgi:hypothetical protein
MSRYLLWAFRNGAGGAHVFIVIVLVLVVVLVGVLVVVLVGVLVLLVV